MTYIQRIQAVLMTPMAVWSSIRNEKGITKAIIYIAIVSFIGGVIRYILATLSVASPMPGGMPGASVGPYGIVGSVVFAIIGLFIGSAIVHLMVYFLGGKGGYNSTFKSVAYGSTPSMLLSGLPYVGFLVSLWAIVLQVLGLEHLHHMSRGKAIAAVLLAFLLIFAVMSLFLVGIFSAVYNSGMMNVQPGMMQPGL